MRFNKLDLNLLVALDAMLTECSISRAAERMHMSQSAMSNALARLREYFDDELLVQVGRRMELTPRAQTLQDVVRDVLVRVDSAIATQPEFDPAQAERGFKLLVSDYTLHTLMPHVLALARWQAPKISFELLPQVEFPQRALERGEADLLIIPNKYSSSEHPVEQLLKEDFCCVVWNGSGLANRPLNFEDFTAAGHVAVTTGGGKPAFEGWLMERYGVTRRIEVTTFSFSAAPALVVGTDRIATVHGRLARQTAKWLPIQLLAMPMPLPQMEQSMQWHKYRTQDPGLRWLRSLIHEASRRMDAEISTVGDPSVARPA